MRVRSGSLLLLLFTLTVLIVGWLGFRLANQQGEQVKMDQIHSAEQTLLLLKNNINQFIEDNQTTLDELRAVDGSMVPGIIRQNPLVDRVVLMGFDQTLILPAEASVETHAFSGQWFQQLPGKNEDQSQQTETAGWLIWHQNQKEKYVYWTRDDVVMFVELNTAMLMGDFIHWLSQQPDITSLNSYLEINDKLGRVFYQWGDEGLKSGSDIDLQRHLEAPFVGWSLRYHSDVALISEAARTVFVLGLLAVLALIAGLTFLLHKIWLREQLESQQKVSFVNKVSHELKTPLTNIRLYGELLERSLEAEGLTESSAQSLKVINQESQRLSRLINNVLSFSTLNRKQMTLTPDEVEFEQVLAAAIQPFEPTFQRLGMVVEIDSQIGGPVQMDEDVFKQIIANLLSNIEKYAPNSKTIHIKARHDEKSGLRVLLVDQGPGVPKRLRNKIFEPFYRVDHSLTESSGTGMGLGIARDLARLHGGDLSLLESPTGACFELLLETGNG